MPVCRVGGIVHMQRILVGSPVRQKSAILTEFLDSLLGLDTGGIALDYFFVDDNDQPASSELLRRFRPRGRVNVVKGASVGPTYEKTEQTHLWREELIWRVAAYKDQMINVARREQYDGLFLIDSDLVLHPQTLRQLVRAQVDIISEIFWTKWQPDVPELPQVWVSDQYTMHVANRQERLTQDEIGRRQQVFLNRLRLPGVYEVGGLGALTLISSRALQAGVSFKEIRNVSMWGEDRHFCIRAAALGLKLYVDTHYPAFHIYRDTDLARLPEFKAAHAIKQHEIEALYDLSEALELWGTTHYETYAGEQHLDRFVGAQRVRLATQAESMVAATRAGQGVSRFYWLWGRARATNDLSGAVEVEGAALQAGRDHGQDYGDHMSVKARMVPGEGRWLVADVDYQSRQEAPAPIPFVRKTRGNKVTLSMLVRNEADRYLRRVLEHAASYVDSAVIVDDGSTDNSVQVCREALQGIPHQIVTLAQSQFHREHQLRRKQWELTVATRPDWILNLDADERFEDRIRTEIRSVINQDQFDMVGFRLYDMWDEEHYREDQYWQAHQIYRPFLVRYVPGMSDEWQETDQHCGRFPKSIAMLSSVGSQVRLQHYGWANPVDRRRKYDRYMQLDPDAKHGVLGQYHSILDPTPRLVRWEA